MGTAVVTSAVLVMSFAAFAHRLGRWSITDPIGRVGDAAVDAELAQRARRIHAEDDTVGSPR